MCPVLLGSKRLTLTRLLTSVPVWMGCRIMSIVDIDASDVDASDVHAPNVDSSDADVDAF